jgi:predicted DNA-binding protein with PD1-like motif
MVVFESRIVRRFVGRLERGEEVVATLRRLCEREQSRAAWVCGGGILEWADLAEWDSEREAWCAPRRVEGLLTLTSLQGNVAIRGGGIWIQLWASLARPHGTGVEVLGGTLAAARVYALDLTLEVYDDVRLERDEDVATGLSLFKGSSVPGVLARGEGGGAAASWGARRAPRPISPLPPTTCGTAPGATVRGEVQEDGTGPASGSGPLAGPITWADVVAASERAASALPAARPPRVAAGPTAAPSPPHLPPPIPSRDPGQKADPCLEEPLPQKGDFVDHRQFGICRVEGEDEDGGLRIRLPSGVRKVIKLHVFEVLPPRHEGDRRIFSLRPRRR